MDWLGQEPRNRTNNSTNNNSSSGRPAARNNPMGDIGQIHQLMMVIIWIVAATIGLWSMAFKQYKWGLYLHFFCMGIVTIITWMSGFLALIYFGTNHRIGPVHTWLGISILISTALQSITGMICWFLQKGSKIRPLIVKISSYIHTIFGWLIFIAVLVQILLFTMRKPKYFLPVIIISLVSYVFYLLFKFLRRKMQLKQGYKQLQSVKSLPLIRNSRDLANINNDYFIFADKVYDIHNILGYHPGGYELIRKIKGREVDRFMYGAEGIEDDPSNKPYLHTSNSISLAGSPIGILQSVNPYRNLTQTTDVAVHQIVRPSLSDSIYAPYLISKYGTLPFIYEGYSQVSQLGKYFTVTINSVLNNLTRLYSVVNFMNTSNINLMSRILGKTPSAGIDSYRSATGLQSNGYINQIQSPNGIPLLIKKYEKGDFTSKFLDGNFTRLIKISPPRGRGLSLHQIQPSELIFVAGGTGLYPFCDFIDLMYKQMLVLSRSRYTDQILSSNPILSQSPIFNKYKVNLYYAVRNAEQIIDIVAYQINQLCSRGLMKAYIKAGLNSHILNNYPSITTVEKPFEQFVSSWAYNIQKIGQIYLCGPPAMTSSLSRTLVQNTVPSQKFRIL